MEFLIRTRTLIFGLADGRIRRAAMALTLLAVSCKEQVKDIHPTIDRHVKPAIIRKPASSFNDTLILDRRSAVFYSPDSAQLEKIKAVNQREIYAMIEHDCHYQMQNARTELKTYWPKIKIVEASKVRYLLFLKEDKSRICIDLNDKNDICGIFLFDRKQNPVLIDMPNVSTALSFYFKK